MGLIVGTDLVAVAEVSNSIRTFGTRYLERVFTDREVEATQGPHQAERLAARFAAKEAVMKALRARDADMAVAWRTIEIRSAPDGAPQVVLHDAARALAELRGVRELAISLSHEHAYATAVAFGITAEAVTGGSLDHG